VRVLFGEGVPEVFQDLPPAVQRKATEIINLLAVFPEMYPERQRGLMTGYRYFTVKEYLFYYSVSSEELRLAAIIPGRMGLA
jgi:plasmid stabilization system protein ParE